MASMKTYRAFTLMIVIEHTRPIIWRRVEVPADITLLLLCRVIQVAMGWSEPTAQYLEYEGRLQYISLKGHELHTPGATRLECVLRTPGKELFYYAGREEEWSHKITLERIQNKIGLKRRVSCVGGERRCPPEACGGPLGFAELLRHLRRPSGHRLPSGYRSWVEGPFNPRVFSRTAVNDRLRQLKI